MAKKETAEEKLLKIIEATKKAQDASSVVSVAPAKARHSSRFAVGVQQINTFLVICALASFAFLGYEVKNGLSLLQQDVTIDVDAKVSGGAVNLFVPQTKSIAYYLDKIASRNIFKPYEKPAAGADVPAGQMALEKRMSKYKMVGIAWLDVPESASVMLEDSTTRMTHFLKEGDKIEDVTVKAIYTDRVVFSYANEEIVIKL